MMFSSAFFDEAYRLDIKICKETGKEGAEPREVRIRSDKLSPLLNFFQKFLDNFLLALLFFDGIQFLRGFVFSILLFIQCKQCSLCLSNPKKCITIVINMISSKHSLLHLNRVSLIT